VSLFHHLFSVWFLFCFRYIVLDRSRCHRSRNGESDQQQFWVAVFKVGRFRRRLLIPFHTKTLAQVLVQSGILQFLQSQSNMNVVWDVFCDQAWDLSFDDWSRCMEMVQSLNHRMTSHCFGLKRQSVQIQVESSLSMVRRLKSGILRSCPDQQAANLLLLPDAAEPHWSMSRELHRQIQSRLNQ
jgi:hypothetical protein